MKKSKAYAVPKYPRVEVSTQRHKKLAMEAKKRNISLRDLVEEKLSAK